MLKNETLGGYITTAIIFLFGIDPSNVNWLRSLLIIIAIDFLLGTLESFKNKTFTRQGLFNGLYRKLCMLISVIIAVQVDRLGMTADIVNVQKIVIGFLIGYETTSVLNHIKIAGVPVAQYLIDATKKISAAYGGNKTK
jgi:toxin secretion/phage lysis holin